MAANDPGAGEGSPAPVTVAKTPCQYPVPMQAPVPALDQNQTLYLSFRSITNWLLESKELTVLVALFCPFASAQI